MRYESFIARRYAFSKKKFTFINIISLLAMLGIAFGVAALIVVLSVFNGFNGLVTSILLDFDPHIKIETVGEVDPVEYASVESFIGHDNDIIGQSKFIQRKAMIKVKEYSQFVWIKGVETSKLASVSNVENKIVLGGFDLKENNSLVLGINLADKLRVLVGDTLTIFSPAGLENILSDMFLTPTIINYRVVGIYQSDNKIYDDSFAFVSLKSAQNLFRMENKITGYEIKLKNINNSDVQKMKMQAALGKNWNVSTWYDLHKDLYSVMKIERWSAFILLCIIVAVAVFNIFASLNMLVLEKKRDIGILQSMGATPAGIQKIFLYDGLSVGILGSTLGLIIGLSLCFLQKQFGLIHLDSAFIIPSLPVEVQLSDIIIIIVSTFILCIIASLYPALKAKKIIPIDAIRWE